MADLRNRRVAVVGSGISGLSASWLLHKNGAKVTLYESESVCGGHTLTDDSCGVPVDLGFQVYNLTTYPNLDGFFQALGVDTEPSDMSFALSVDNGCLEWASHSLESIFVQRRNALSPSFLLMIKDVIRFGKEARNVLRNEGREYATMTLGAYLDDQKYSQSFIHHYVLPMCAAVWSVSMEQVLSFPVVTLVRFWSNHHLLDLTQRPCWRVVVGRSRSYVHRVVAELPDVRVSTPVKSVVPVEGRGDDGDHGVRVTTSDGSSEVYDDVILATHSDVSQRILDDGETKLQNILSAIPYAENDVWLHSDASLMPRQRKAWASWNCISSSRAPGSQSSAVCVTYWINNLQSLPPGTQDLFVTLNPPVPPASDKVFKRLKLAHPMFSFKSDAAQAALSSVNGSRHVWLAGAWCGYGFHEDGINSAIQVVKALGGSIPWNPVCIYPRIGWVDWAAIRIFDKFAKSAIVNGRIRVILPNGYELCYGSATSEGTSTTKSASGWKRKAPLSATIRLKNASFFRKIITRHDVGMGESYMDGDYEVDDLGALLAVATANAYNIQDKRGLLGAFNWVGEKVLKAAHATRSNTVAGSRRNIEEHYDAGNAMYRLFLDESMTYSCAIWEEGNDCNLHDAQMAKLDALIKAAGIQPGDKVLEIGCGWGSFAMRCAERIPGCTITGLTVSKEQLAEATQRVAAAGLSERITLLFCDYRDCPGLGTYDRVVSCEMIEAVGHEHMDAFFRTIGLALKQGGSVALQVIATPDERYVSYKDSSDFIREHVFPGGHLPCMGAMVESARGTGLSVRACRDIGPDYAVTLRAWRDAWEKGKDDVLSLLGYSERFWRKYRFYFAYCEAGFDCRYIHTFQLTWQKDGMCTLTPEDIQRSIEKSKGLKFVSQQRGTKVEAFSSSSSSSSPPSRVDTKMQILLSVYFFLVGVAVSKSYTLWVLPLATLCAALVYGVSGLVALKTFGYSPEQASITAANASHVLYSLWASVLVGVLVLSRPGSVLLLKNVPSPEALPRAVVASSAGFFAFFLWAEVHTRHYQRGYLQLLHYTLLTCLFFAAAFKNEQTGFLCLTLLSEVNSLTRVAAKLFRKYKAFESADKYTFVIFRAVPHFVLGCMVAFQPRAFSKPLYWGLGLAGMIHMNVANMRKALFLFNKIHNE